MSLDSPSYTQLLPMSFNSNNSVRFINEGQGPCIKVENLHAKAVISLFGGHMLSFIPRKDELERLWLSDKAIFDGKTPIRGGIPICWPWFAAYESAGFSTPQSSTQTLPSHGFARTQYWRVEQIQESSNESVDTQESGKLCLTHNTSSTTLTLVPTKLGLFSFSEDIHVKLIVTISETLSISLQTMNRSNQAVEITQALHSYFNIPNIYTSTLHGINEDYDDKPSATCANKTLLPYIFEQEVDRIHHIYGPDLGKVKVVTITHLCKDTPSQIVSIQNIGHDSLVVWNPWQQKSQAMKDMTSDGYRTMLCVEAANTKATKVAAGASFSLQQIIS